MSQGGFKNKKRIAVIGLGAAGLCSLKQIKDAFSRSEVVEREEVEVVGFESNSDVGGVWFSNEKPKSYQKKNHKSEKGEETVLVYPEKGKDPSPMYPGLRVNVPSDLMAFREHLFPPDAPEFGDRQTIQDYLSSYAKTFSLYPLIRFNTRVTRLFLTPSTPSSSTSFPSSSDSTLNPSPNSPFTTQSNSSPDPSSSPSSSSNPILPRRWTLRSKNLLTDEENEETFDFISIANGHYYDGHIPSIPGLATFPGEILHSRYYHKPEDYRGKTVLVVGSSASGQDTSRHLASLNLPSHLRILARGKPSSSKIPLTPISPNVSSSPNSSSPLEGNDFDLENASCGDDLERNTSGLSSSSIDINSGKRGTNIIPQKQDVDGKSDPNDQVGREEVEREILPTDENYTKVYLSVTPQTAFSLSSEQPWSKHINLVSIISSISPPSVHHPKGVIHFKQSTNCPNGVIQDEEHIDQSRAGVHIDSPKIGVHIDSSKDEIHNDHSQDGIHIDHSKDGIQTLKQIDNLKETIQTIDFESIPTENDLSDIDVIIFATGYYCSLPFCKVTDEPWKSQRLLDGTIEAGEREGGWEEEEGGMKGFMMKNLDALLLFLRNDRSVAFPLLPYQIVPFPFAEIQARLVALLWAGLLPSFPEHPTLPPNPGNPYFTLPTPPPTPSPTNPSLDSPLSLSRGLSPSMPSIHSFASTSSNSKTSGLEVSLSEEISVSVIDQLAEDITSNTPLPQFSDPCSNLNIPSNIVNDPSTLVLQKNEVGESTTTSDNQEEGEREIGSDEIKHNVRTVYAMRQKFIFPAPYEWAYTDYIMSITSEAEKGSEEYWRKVEPWRIVRRAELGAGLRKRVLGY
ncbi:hypothetical protein TREMEDRAFT_65802 [Tremella mesenterica DSM 1558]|uniref:uncharacterized protein n=1 Tax=Tremella mesenterica (strain ATCC 24925 / CBS 8224 / DSM 1558 / NBRC 9311 / NRRL Y-6157 / RJB 2259-6 / UBC 559-6) TaxID=578456 RepID=UPI00032BC62A|nr:uncharacterized protein TREMEDRAFT_65802 [Tremella mesenterica DSM 1558]EIW66196.1 hypothetical protein TREMEDRAFT_65802 [Tremella mesenterica DSM 1558]